MDRVNLQWFGGFAIQTNGGTLRQPFCTYEQSSSIWMPKKECMNINVLSYEDLCMVIIQINLSLIFRYSNGSSLSQTQHKNTVLLREWFNCHARRQWELRVHSTREKFLQKKNRKKKKVKTSDSATCTVDPPGDGLVFFYRDGEVSNRQQPVNSTPQSGGPFVPL